MTYLRCGDWSLHNFRSPLGLCLCFQISPPIRKKTNNMCLHFVDTPTELVQRIFQEGHTIQWYRLITILIQTLSRHSHETRRDELFIPHNRYRSPDIDNFERLSLSFSLFGDDYMHSVRSRLPPRESPLVPNSNCSCPLLSRLDLKRDESFGHSRTTTHYTADGWMVVCSGAAFYHTPRKL